MEGLPFELKCNHIAPYFDIRTLCRLRQVSRQFNEEWVHEYVWRHQWNRVCKAHPEIGEIFCCYSFPYLFTAPMSAMQQLCIWSAMMQYNIPNPERIVKYMQDRVSRTMEVIDADCGDLRITLSNEIIMYFWDTHKYVQSTQSFRKRWRQFLLQEPIDSIRDDFHIFIWMWMKIIPPPLIEAF